MKTLMIIAAACVLACGESAPARPLQPHQLARTAKGNTYVKHELKVVLREPFARGLTEAAGARQPVDTGPLLRLHPEVVAVKGGHTCARRWLKGEALPQHIRQEPGRVTRIARRITLELRPGADAAQVLPVLKQHPNVESVGLSYLHPVNEVPNDTLYANQWAPAKIGLEAAWDVLPRGFIRVAIVDTGVDLQHPELAGSIVYHEGFGDFDDGDAPTDQRRDFDHGTHVAGIAAAERNNSQGIAGVTNHILLLAMGCAAWSDDAGRYVIEDADDAIDEAVARGARVINCSFGRFDDLVDAVSDAVDDASDNNVLIVAAAGNDGQDVSALSWNQNAAPFVISNMQQDDSLGSLSNFGSGIDLGAPGTGIYSTVPTGGTGVPYDYMSGTSMAAPAVAGAAALVMGMNPTLIEDHSARHLLIRMAKDVGTPGRDNRFGDGRLFLSAPVLKAIRGADAFVSPVDGISGANGNYDQPWSSLPAALAAVPDYSVLVLNGGDVDAAVYRYPPITITKPCTLEAIPDRPVSIGQL